MAVLANVQPRDHALDTFAPQALLAPERLGVLRCPICGTPYDAEAIRFVRTHGTHLTLAAQCDHCHTGALLTVDTEPQAESELLPAEQVYFAAQPRLADADVEALRVHIRALEDFGALTA